MDGGRSNLRWRESKFKDGDPTVLIVGVGQIGVRSKHLDISSVLVRRNARVGDNWRDRYETLCLHDPSHL